jgi:hypothetical protein
MELIKGNTAPEVWLSASEYLLGRKPHEDFDVFLNLATPTALSAADRQTLKLVDQFLVDHNGLPLSTVAETIFPMQDYLRGGAKAVHTTYPERMAAIHRARSDRRWGCYAMRLLRKQDSAGATYNPLEQLIKKLKEHNKYKACYELGVGDTTPFEDDIPIYNPDSDRKPVYGNLPCLSHISIKADQGRVRMNATYRSHYYVQRLLGNIIGLGRLQYFIAREANLDVGPLTINSTYARLDTGSNNGSEASWGIKDIEALIGDCRAVYAQSAAA